MSTTTTDTTRAVAYHTAAATNGLATVAGHLAKLRELTADPVTDDTLRDALARLGALSGTVRRLGGEAGR